MLLAGIAIAAAPGRVRGEVDGELAALTAGLPACDAARAHCFGIRLHVAVGAEAGAGPIAQAEWLAVQLATANLRLAPLDVGVQVVGIDALPASAGHIATRGDRDALAAGGLAGKLIHVFITGRLDDVDEPGGVIRGVAWHTRGSDRKYVILSTVAPERVLAHELGHVFGLPHSSYPRSIMNKAPRAEPPPEDRVFVDDEIAAMRPVVARLLQGGAIGELARPERHPR